MWKILSKSDFRLTTHTRHEGTITVHRYSHTPTVYCPRPAVTWDRLLLSMYCHCRLCGGAAADAHASMGDMKRRLDKLGRALCAAVALGAEVVDADGFTTARDAVVAD